MKYFFLFCWLLCIYKRHFLLWELYLLYVLYLWYVIIGLATRVQILDKTDCISHGTYTLGMCHILAEWRGWVNMIYIYIYIYIYIIYIYILYKNFCSSKIGSTWSYLFSINPILTQQTCRWTDGELSEFHNPITTHQEHKS